MLSSTSLSRRACGGDWVLPGAGRTVSPDTGRGHAPGMANLLLVGSFLWLSAVYCEAFTLSLGKVLRISTVPTMMTKAETQVWAPTVPKVVDLSKGALVTEHGVEKSAFEAFFSKTESTSYCGYKWDLVNNNVLIVDTVNMQHEKASRAFERVIGKEPLLDDLYFGGSGLLMNPASGDSNWQPDGSYFPRQRQGPMGSNDKTTPYPTMVLEIATTETDDHVFDKAHKYLGPNTAIQIVVVLLVRPTYKGADRLQALKFERGQQNPCWQCSFADPLCKLAGDSSFRLPLPVGLLFDSAPIPAALAGKVNVNLDLFLWKQWISWP